MRVRTEALRRLALTSLLIVLASLAASPARSQQASGSKSPAKAVSPQPTESQTRARAILMQMAEFIGTTPRFSVSLRTGYDAVQGSGQKIEFAETQQITVSRPRNLRVESARSDGAKMLAVFTGTEIALIDVTANVIATAPQPGPIDETLVHFVQDLRMRLPLAAMLLSRLPAELDGRVKFIDYVEKTGIHGSPAHHLAARTDTVDFQIWITEGDKPLPQRVVITYKNAQGQPQFWAQLADWNLAPTIAESTFAAIAPEGAQKSDVRGAASARRSLLRASQSRAKEPSDAGFIVVWCRGDTSLKCCGSGPAGRRICGARPRGWRRGEGRRGARRWGGGGRVFARRRRVARWFRWGRRAGIGCSRGRAESLCISGRSPAERAVRTDTATRFGERAPRRSAGAAVGQSGEPAGPAVEQSGSEVDQPGRPADAVSVQSSQSADAVSVQSRQPAVHRDAGAKHESIYCY